MDRDVRPGVTTHHFQTSPNLMHIPSQRWPLGLLCVLSCDLMQQRWSRHTLTSAFSPYSDLSCEDAARTRSESGGHHTCGNLGKLDTYWCNRCSKHRQRSSDVLWLVIREEWSASVIEKTIRGIMVSSITILFGKSSTPSIVLRSKLRMAFAKVSFLMRHLSS